MKHIITILAISLFIVGCSSESEELTEVDISESNDIEANVKNEESTEEIPANPDTFETQIEAEIAGASPLLEKADEMGITDGEPNLGRIGAVRWAESGISPNIVDDVSDRDDQRMFSLPPVYGDSIYTADVVKEMPLPNEWADSIDIDRNDWFSNITYNDVVDVNGLYATVHDIKFDMIQTGPDAGYSMIVDLSYRNEMSNAVAIKDIFKMEVRNAPAGDLKPVEDMYIWPDHDDTPHPEDILIGQHDTRVQLIGTLPNGMEMVDPGDFEDARIRLYSPTRDDSYAEWHTARP